jgi:hypothetical protein
MPANFARGSPISGAKSGQRARMLLTKDWLLGAIGASLILRAQVRSWDQPRRATSLGGVEAVRRMASR